MRCKKPSWGLVAALVAGVVAGLWMDEGWARPGEAASVRRSAGRGATRVGRGDDIGVGLRFGEPTGLTLKYFMTPTSALHLVAWPRNGGVDTAGDYLYHFRNLASGSVVELMAYLGGGVGLTWQQVDQAQAQAGGGGKGKKAQPGTTTTTTTSRTDIVVRGIVGGEVAFARVPIGVFAELVPHVDVQLNNLALAGSLGARYYF